jgi:ferritin-like metal-binding protein YciE
MAKEPKKLDELFHDTLKDIYFAEKKIRSRRARLARPSSASPTKALRL